jgi:hypothetical protein
MKKEADTITIKISEFRRLTNMCEKVSLDATYLVGLLNNYIAELPPEPEIKKKREGNITTPHPAVWGRTAAL